VAGILWIESGAYALLSGDPTHWEMRISLYNSSAKDTQNGVGVDLNSANSLDTSDVLEPPALPGKLSLAVQFSDPGPLARDVGEPVVRNRSWMITAGNLLAGDTHFVLLDGMDTVPSEYQVLLIDYVGGFAQDLHASPQYMFTPIPGESGRSFELRVYNPPPGRPDKVITIPGVEMVTVSWTSSPDPDVTGYTVYKGTEPGVYDTSYTVGNINDLALTGLDDGGTYYIAVSAVDRSGLEGDLSVEIKYPPDPIPVPDFDVDHNGVINYVDLFSFAGAWMKPAESVTMGDTSAFQEVGPGMLNQFLSVWRVQRESASTK